MLMIEANNRATSIAEKLHNQLEDILVQEAGIMVDELWPELTPFERSTIANKAAQKVMDTLGEMYEGG